MPFLKKRILLLLISFFSVHTYAQCTHVLVAQAMSMSTAMARALCYQMQLNNSTGCLHESVLGNYWRQSDYKDYNPGGYTFCKEMARGQVGVGEDGKVASNKIYNATELLLDATPNDPFVFLITDPFSLVLSRMNRDLQYFLSIPNIAEGGTLPTFPMYTYKQKLKSFEDAVLAEYENLLKLITRNATIGRNVLLVYSSQLINNPTNTLNTVLDAWGFPLITTEEIPMSQASLYYGDKNRTSMYRLTYDDAWLSTRGDFFDVGMVTSASDRLEKIMNITPHLELIKVYRDQAAQLKARRLDIEQLYDFPTNINTTLPFSANTHDDEL